MVRTLRPSAPFVTARRPHNLMITISNWMKFSPPRQTAAVTLHSRSTRQPRLGTMFFLPKHRPVFPLSAILDKPSALLGCQLADDSPFHVTARQRRRHEALRLASTSLRMAWQEGLLSEGSPNMREAQQQRSAVICGGRRAVRLLPRQVRHAHCV